jgi:hypothetical protein
MFRIDILRDEKIKKAYKEWKLTNEEYINQLWKLYYKNKSIIDNLK